MKVTGHVLCVRGIYFVFVSTIFLLDFGDFYNSVVFFVFLLDFGVFYDSVVFFVFLLDFGFFNDKQIKIYVSQFKIIKQKQFEKTCPTGYQENE
jgi:hypothetical protein